MRTALYRHFDAEGRLLYVGISDCLSARSQAHGFTSTWFHLVVRSEVQWLNSRDHAMALERVAIHFEKPLHNQANTKALLPSEAMGREAALVDLIEAAAVKLNIAPSTLGERVGQGGKFYARIKAGGGVMPRTDARIRKVILDLLEAA